MSEAIQTAITELQAVEREIGIPSKAVPLLLAELGRIEMLNEEIAEARAALAEFNSESLVVMAQRAAEEIARLRSEVSQQ